MPGREAIESFLRSKWERELEYRLIKEIWGFRENRIAVRFAYEWQDRHGSWFRRYANENWFRERACICDGCATHPGLRAGRDRGLRDRFGLLRSAPGGGGFRATDQSHPDGRRRGGLRAGIGGDHFGRSSFARLPWLLGLGSGASLLPDERRLRFCAHAGFHTRI